VTKRAGAEASLLIAACIVLPQIIVAVLSPAVGFIAEQRGRRIVLFVCCAMLPVRGVLFSMFDQPLLLVAIQALDGISAACFGVLVPLVTSDVARRSGHFNLALGAVGFAIGIGATLSTTGAGWVADRMGDSAAFLVLALAGLAAVGVVALMPETRPPRNQRR
jgi:MFS family permease